MNNKKLPGDYVAGFVDGEGCFALKLRKDTQKNKETGRMREYLYWNLEFAIVLRPDDAEILELIQNSIRCGKITYTKDGSQVRLSVQNSGDILNVVIPFFEKYKLHAKKKIDFELWKEACCIVGKYRNGQLNTTHGKRGFIKKEFLPADTRRLVEIRNKMVIYKSDRTRPFKY